MLKNAETLLGVNNGSLSNATLGNVVHVRLNYFRKHANNTRNLEYFCVGHLFSCKNNIHF